MLSLYRNHFFFVIRSASLADSMRYHQSAAFAAFDQGRFAHLPICSAAVSSCLRGFIFGTNRHVILPPIFPDFPYFLKPYLSIITTVPLFVNTFFPLFSTYLHPFAVWKLPGHAGVPPVPCPAEKAGRNRCPRDIMIPGAKAFSHAMQDCGSTQCGAIWYHRGQNTF